MRKELAVVLLHYTTVHVDMCATIYMYASSLTLLCLQEKVPLGICRWHTRPAAATAAAQTLVFLLNQFFVVFFSAGESPTGHLLLACMPSSSSSTDTGVPVVIFLFLLCCRRKSFWAPAIGLPAQQQQQHSRCEPVVRLLFLLDCRRKPHRASAAGIPAQQQQQQPTSAAGDVCHSAASSQASRAVRRR
jgi:hypothetical protein